jgi:acyl-CoA thioester hydrolase
MKPQPLALAPLENDRRFFRDENTGLIWHATNARVLYAETDRSGAVYHANHLRYFELGRATLMRDLGHPYSAVEESGFSYPIIGTGLNYYQFLNYDQAFTILTRPGRLERVRIAFDYIIVRQGEERPVADGFTLHCALNHRCVPVAIDPMTLATWNMFPRS